MADIKKTEAPQKRELLSEPLGESRSEARRTLDRITTTSPEDLSKAIDEQLKNVPPATFLAVALGAMGVSATLALFNERKGIANFFGAWVPSLLFLTCYTKLLKLEHAFKEEKSNPTVH